MLTANIYHADHDSRVEDKCLLVALLCGFIEIAVRSHDATKNSSFEFLMLVVVLADRRAWPTPKIIRQLDLTTFCPPQIHKENLSCEIDPARLRSSDILECNLDNLTRNIDSVYSAIINSGRDCPYTLSSLFSNLQKQAIQHFPGKFQLIFQFS